jgi:methylthioribose-1-phosphate isomerase
MSPGAAKLLLCVAHVSGSDPVDIGVRPFRLADGGERLLVLDQRRLPGEERWLEMRDIEAVAIAIETLAVRGAPAIGCVAALGLAVAARGLPGEGESLVDAIELAAARLARTRPTAVNLFVALNEVRDAARLAAREGRDVRGAVLAAAMLHADRDLEACLAIGRHGAALMPDGGCVLTHCNAGALATAGYGTALGVIRAAWAAGKRFRVLADETRPVLQGARLTAWELAKDGIDVEVITDAMAATFMRRGDIAAAIVGADRIARNGDVANKIGTYSVAVLCHHHGIPFYVAAPWTTIDLRTADGAAIPIEERDADEVRRHGGTIMTPPGMAVRNPAFDVTPAALVTAIVTERGVHRPGELPG